MTIPKSRTPYYVSRCVSAEIPVIRKLRSNCMHRSVQPNRFNHLPPASEAEGGYKSHVYPVQTGGMVERKHGPKFKDYTSQAQVGTLLRQKSYINKGGAEAAS